MATQPELIDTAETRTDLIVVEAQRNAVALFTDEQKYDEFYERVKESVADFVPDVTTDKGRREVASMAFRVTKAKTTLDKAGFALTEDWRKKTAAVNAARKKMTSQLDALADEVRKPLTVWEAKESERREFVANIIQRLRNSAAVQEGETVADVEARLERVRTYALDEELMQDRMAEARDTLDATAATLERAVARLRQEEADRAELDRLRREAAERDEQNREAERLRLERERAERAEQEAQERARREKEDSDRRIREAEERARIEAEERARAEAEENLAVERRAREAAEREAEDARRKEQERLAWEAKERREREAREADERHRKAVIDEIIADLQDVTEGSLSSQQEALIAHAIAGGSIRHVSVRF